MGLCLGEFCLSEQVEKLVQTVKQKPNVAYNSSLYMPFSASSVVKDSIFF